MAIRKTYSKAFKVEAVRLLGLGEKPAAQLALEPGVRRNQLYKWHDRIDGKSGAAHDGQRLDRIHIGIDGVFRRGRRHGVEHLHQIPPVARDMPDLGDADAA